MKYADIVNGPQNASRIILGCMRMPALRTDEAANIIRTACEMGINCFDHAPVTVRTAKQKRASVTPFPKQGSNAKKSISRASAVFCPMNRNLAGQRKISSRASTTACAE